METNFLFHCFFVFRPFETVLKNLEPLFELDFLLPRTFMTAVDLQDLDKVIQTRKIPMEVCLANLTYHVKTNRPRPYGIDMRFPYTLSLGEKVHSYFDILYCIMAGV